MNTATTIEAVATPWYQTLAATMTPAECVKAAIECLDDYAHVAAEFFATSAITRESENPAAATVAHALLYLALLGQHRFPEALTVARMMVATWPHDPGCHDMLGNLLIQIGDRREGLRETDYRRQIPAIAAVLPPLPGPEWNGGPLPARTLLIRELEGLGAAIDMARHVPGLARQGVSVTFLCGSELAPLLRHQPGFACVVAPLDPLPPYDAWVDGCRLPLLCEDFDHDTPAPGANGYLSADIAKVVQARGRLMSHCAAAGLPYDRLTVGLCWAGNPLRMVDWQRSMALPELQPILDVPGVNFVSLQVGPRGAELKGPNVARQPHLADLDDTAAWLENIDLVVTVDTSVAHLAGALGVPVWLCLPWISDCRWGLSDRTRLWRSARLWRQQAPGDWRGVTRRIAEALTEIPTAPHLGGLLLPA